ncbi:hypothetical protein SETIT_6G063400v2 [Setaria italica]|uniref:Aquaporin n=1 Tax=Setaria italica TaxID=4555 RepID=A0A368RIM2_SETIT|nr:hypothetical protein SETIT_6G063400v2 [Setaria italica]
MDPAAVTVPPVQSSESNKISIIISPRAASSKLINAGSISSHPDANPAESFDAHATHYHRWNQGLSKMKAVPLIKKVIAEFLGTFILNITVLSTIIMNEQHDGVESLLGIATSAGLAVTILVLSLIHISGCHLKPAVSIAMSAFGHLPLAHLLPYMTAQILGSITASFTVKGIYHPVNPGIATVPKFGTVKELIAVAVGAEVMMNALVAGCT